MFSKSAEYALRAVIFIAQKSSADQKLNTAAIAAGIGAPASFTAKIMQRLTKNGRIIRAVRGPHGGFYITTASKKLPVVNILYAMGEEELFSKCVLGLKKCSDVEPCPMHHGYQPVKRKLLDLFSVKTIGELAKDMTSGEAVIKNQK